MKEALKYLVVFATFAICFSSISSYVNAGSYGGPYGSPGTPDECRIVIDVVVSNPAISKTVEYLDNTTASTGKYKPNQAVIARIKVKNTSNRALTSVKIVNEIPQCFSYIAGPGMLNKGGNSLTIDVGDMSAQEEKVFYVTYKVADESCFPLQPITCVSNKITVHADACNAQDTAQLCVERQILGTTKGGQPLVVNQTPDTGPEFALGFAALSGLVGGAGYYIKKKLGSIA